MPRATELTHPTTGQRVKIIIDESVSAEIVAKQERLRWSVLIKLGGNPAPVGWDLSVAVPRHDKRGAKQFIGSLRRLKAQEPVASVARRPISGHLGARSDFLKGPRRPR
jgi:hypothetical protein